MLDKTCWHKCVGHGPTKQTKRHNTIEGTFSPMTLSLISHESHKHTHI